MACLNAVEALGLAGSPLLVAACAAGVKVTARVINCQLCGVPIEVSFKPPHLQLVGGGLRLSVDPGPIAGHLLECFGSGLGPLWPQASDR